VLRAVIFDLDGLLIDSEPHWRAAEMQVLGALGLELSEAMCVHTTGLRIDEVVSYWHTRAPWPGPGPAEVVTRIVAQVIDRLRAHGVAKPGALHAVQWARRRGVALGLASSSPMALIHAAVEQLGLAGAFDVLASAEDEPYGKPHPQVYLAAAQRLHVAPTACLALEDSLNGLIAAKAARMRCVVVPEHGTADPRWSLADRVLGSLVDLDDAAWAALDRDDEVAPY
jgi:mannitol-1-/sugar-/sorbitol-6-/2-deoxyglucose-6-phosphatase